VLLAVITVPLLSSLVIELPAPGLPAPPRLLAAPMVAHSSLRPIPGISLCGVTQPWRVGVQVGHHVGGARAERRAQRRDDHGHSGRGGLSMGRAPPTAGIAWLTAAGLLAAASVAVAQQALDVDEAELRAAEGTVEWVNFTGVVR